MITRSDSLDLLKSVTIQTIQITYKRSMKFKTSFYTLILSAFILLFTSSLLAKPSIQKANFSAKELEALQGHFSTIYGYMYIRANGKKVGTKFDNKYFQLVKKTDGHFYPQYKLLRFIPISLGKMSFQVESTENKTQIKMFQPNKNTRIVAQKFTPKAIPSLWKKRLGNYKASVIKGSSNIRQVRLTIKNGILVAYVNKLSNPYPLIARADSTIYSPSAGHNQDQAISIQANAQGMHLSYGNNRLFLKKLP